jgi:hypothetical protein
VLAKEKGSAAMTLDSSLPTADSTGEVDKWRCRVAGKVAVRFALAGVTWSRGEAKEGCGAGIPF